MSTTFLPSTRCTFVPHYRKCGRVNYAESNFHAVTYSPVKGADDDQIKRLFWLFEKDIEMKEAIAGSFGVEGTGTSRKVLISFVLTRCHKTSKTKTRYENYIFGVKPDGNNKELSVSQPPTNEMPNLTIASWLAFPVKTIAANIYNKDQITANMFNSGTFAVKNLFAHCSTNNYQDQLSLFKSSIIKMNRKQYETIPTSEHAALPSQEPVQTPESQKLASNGPRYTTINQTIIPSIECASIG